MFNGSLNLEVIAVDFDGTLCENHWPGIGLPHLDMIDWMKRLRKEGHKVVLWTCREGMQLIDAIVWCADHGLFFDAVNDNIEEYKKLFKGNSRKIMADWYIDDKSVYPSSVSFVLKRSGCR